MKTILVSSLGLSLFLLLACSGGSGSVASSSGANEPDPSGKDPTPDEVEGSSNNGSSSSGGGSSGGGSSSGSTSSSGGGKPNGATDVTCKVAEDCGYWFCDCESNPPMPPPPPPVNARDCNNGWCMDAPSVCPDACAAFGYKWTGSFGGSAQK